MLRIDSNLLTELGLGGLPEAEKNSLLKHIYETLEMRVGMRLADQMTNEQLDEFEKYFEAKDDAGAFKWLEANFPNYKDIVQEEFDKLKNEVAQSAPQILANSQANAAAPAPQAQPVAQAEPVAAAPAPQQPAPVDYQPAPAQPAPMPPQPVAQPVVPQQPVQPMQPPAPVYEQPAAQPAPQQPQPGYQPQPPFPGQQPPAGPPQVQ